MEMQLQICGSVESEIRTVFRGVTLGRGISLRQAQFAGGFQEPACKTHPAPPAHGQITDDWSQVPLDELENDFFAHLNALGFRYYIPALMLSCSTTTNHRQCGSSGRSGDFIPRKIIAGGII